MAAKTLLDLSMEGKDVDALDGTELMLVEQYDEDTDTYISRSSLLSLLKTWITNGLATVAQAKAEFLTIAVSDESTALTTGTAKITFRMPYAMTLSGVRANINTESSSGIVTVDINKNGNSVLGTKLTIDEGEKTSTTASTLAVISDTSLTDDAEITIDIDVAGSGAKGLKVTLIGTRA